MLQITTQEVIQSQLCYPELKVCFETEGSVEGREMSGIAWE